MPVDPATLAGFVAATLAIVLSPGPDSLLILRYTIAGGQRVGIATVAGVQLGLIGHTLLATLGVSIIIATSPLLFRSVAIIGALYLAWLGLQGIRPHGLVRLDKARQSVSAAKACRDAMLTNLFNPKVILLFLALLPNFVVPERGNVPLQLAILGSTLIVVNTLWQLPLAWGAERIRRWLSNPHFERIISVGTGGILIAIAVLMLWENLRAGP